MSPKRLASFSASAGRLGYDDDARPHVRHVAVLIAAHHGHGQNLRIALLQSIVARVMGSSGSAYVFWKMML